MVPSAELLVLDHAVPDAGRLLAAAARPHRHGVVRPDDDGLAALTAILTAAGPVDAVHLVSHGAPGLLRLGAGAITRDTLERRPAALAVLARALAGAPVILYGCEVGAGATGRAFVAALAAALGAPVRASSTPTGAAARGGDWELDVGTAPCGTVAMPRPLLDATRAAAWSHLLGNAANDGELATEFTNTGDAGTVTLTTDGFAYTVGAATVNSIDLEMGGGVTTASIAGGPITPAGALGDTLNVNLGATQTLTIGAVLADGAGTLLLAKSGDGVLTLSGTNTYDGTTTVSAGTLSVAADSNLGDGAVTLNSGTLAVTGANITIDNAISLGAGNGTLSSAVAWTLSGNTSGAGRLTKTGIGTLTLTGDAGHTGGTTMSAGAALRIGNFGTTGSLTGDVVNDGGIIFARSDSLTFGGDISGTGTLTKAGTGTLLLTGTNSYTGTTDLLNGTLRVNGSLGATAVTVQNTATLGGAGSIAGAVTVESGGTLAPGNSPGQLATGSLTLDAGAIATFEVNGTTVGTQYDQVVVTGTVDVTGATLTTTFGFTSATGNAFTLIDNNLADAVTGTFTGLAEGASFASGGRTYQISYVAGDGNDVVLTDITSGGGGGGGGGDDGSTSPVNATPFADVLTGTSGNDTISALASADSVQGGSGADLIYGNPGADTLLGGADADSLYGGQDGDLVRGDDGADALHGNLGADTLSGGIGDDLVYGNEEADVAYGNLGADTLFGGQGDDTAYGGQDADVLHGNLGADALYGGQGDDSLFGGAGNDLLAGGAGADRHAFVDGSGSDSVLDFSAAEGDRIAVAADINGTGIAGAADLLARLSSDASGDAVLDLGLGNLVTLIGVQQAAATADWFLVA